MGPEQGLSALAPSTTAWCHPPMWPLDTEMEILTAPECRALLGSGSFGRVGLTIGALPSILPVNYALLEGEVVFRTGDGPKLRAALERAVVAFEVDDIDEAQAAGWSVLVVGHASNLWRTHEIEQAYALDLRPWAPGKRDSFVRITTEMISGRRIPAPGPDHDGRRSLPEQ